MEEMNTDSELLLDNVEQLVSSGLSHRLAQHLLMKNQDVLTFSHKSCSLISYELESTNLVSIGDLVQPLEERAIVCDVVLIEEKFLLFFVSK